MTWRLRAQEVAHRRPYEVLLLARKASGSSSASQVAEEAPAPAAGVSDPAPAVGVSDPTPGGPAPPDPEPVPDKLVLVACPQEHSRKPQLGPALAPLLPPQPRCLEVIQSLCFPRSPAHLCKELVIPPLSCTPSAKN